MLFHFAATLEYNDRKVHIIKLLKAEKEAFSSTAAHHITAGVSEETLASSPERTCLTKLQRGRKWKDGLDGGRV